MLIRSNNFFKTALSSLVVGKWTGRCYDRPSKRLRHHTELTKQLELNIKLTNIWWCYPAVNCQKSAFPFMLKLSKGSKRKSWKDLFSGNFLPLISGSIWLGWCPIWNATAFHPALMQRHQWGWCSDTTRAINFGRRDSQSNWTSKWKNKPFFVFCIMLNVDRISERYFIHHQIKHKMMHSHAV